MLDAAGFYIDNNDNKSNTKILIIIFFVQILISLSQMKGRVRGELMMSCIIIKRALVTSTSRGGDGQSVVPLYN